MAFLTNFYNKFAMIISYIYLIVNTSINFNKLKVYLRANPVFSPCIALQLRKLKRRQVKIPQAAIEIKLWPVSGGSKENPSPTGSWAVIGIGNWGGWRQMDCPKCSLGQIWHSWHDEAVGSNNIPHGCIRMENNDVAELKK